MSYDDDAIDLFAAFQDGVQPDGTVIVDLGFCGFHMATRLGIEPLLGLSGFESGKQFMELMKVIAQSTLKDWEPHQLTLFQCWFAPHQTHDDLDVCCVDWRIEPPEDALKIFSCTVFVLRHKAWRLAANGHEIAFHCARQRSHAEALCEKSNKDSSDPQIMDGITDAGFHLVGKKPGVPTGADVFLSWPSPDLLATLAKADELALGGYTDISLSEGGLSWSLADLTDEDRAVLIKRYHYYGGEMSLHDLMG